MKLILIILSFIFSSGFAFGQLVVSAEFTSKTTFEDLIEIQREMADKNIQLTYKQIELDETNHLKALSIEVETKGPSSTTFGSGKLMDFSTNGKITFKLDYNPKGDPAIEIKVLPFGI